MNSKTLKLFILMVVVAGAGLLTAARQEAHQEKVAGSYVSETEIPFSPDPVKSRAAFDEAVKVFFSARCANCHPAGDIPTQGDQMTPHAQGVVRGKDGFGVYGQKCSACHQLENLAGEHMPPGTAKPWHMPPSSMPMVFQGLTPGQLCRNFKDPSKNGGSRDAAKVVEHIKKRDPLVIWAWQPGNNRTLPPLSYEEFSAKVEEWVKNGSVCPE